MKSFKKGSEGKRKKIIKRGGGGCHERQEVRTDKVGNFRSSGFFAAQAREILLFPYPAQIAGIAKDLSWN
jgi:hypothetical protein